MRPRPIRLRPRVLLDSDRRTEQPRLNRASSSFTGTGQVTPTTGARRTYSATVERLNGRSADPECRSNLTFAEIGSVFEA
jgi:hypothetical protein